MKFVKMNGCGNDYVYFDLRGESDPAAAAEQIIPHIVRLSDRHFGVGGDGVVLVMPSAVADVRMRMFNADGSEGKMCGNAVRCVCKLVCDGRAQKPQIVSVETASGIKTIVPECDAEGVCTGAAVNMGLPVLDAEKVPLDLLYAPSCSALYDRDGATVALRVPVTVRGEVFYGTAVSMGNPHFVIFTDKNPADVDVARIGSEIEVMPLFPERVNVEFVKDCGGGVFAMRVWERGSGETLACGTGSCAVAVAASLNGLAPRADGIYEITLLGGTLYVSIGRDGVIMTGNAEKNYEGDVKL